ncbi:MAG: Oxygen-independent coproporphyrinogen-III oxidase-like protein YqeR [bacterium]|nr:Oxygen-independent coproporphyrinogen-III oxidase-like protein YqeR [bacterium]
MPTAALYIHIPFCEKRCVYCDFYTVAGVESRLPDYIKALKKEMALRAAETFWQRQRFATIFFGGGTPSLLAPPEIAEILDTAFASFHFAAHPEITLEANPGTITSAQLARYRAAGINRLSLGIQSLHVDELERLDRIHSPQQAIDAVVMARHAGFENINMDFIFALPQQTLGRWQDNLAQAVELRPTHISAYNLTIEPGTPLEVKIRKGEIQPLSEEEERAFFQFTIDFLERHGWQQYEVSNFAKPGYEARHNIKYWDGSAYLGLGASAHSYDGKRRFWNVANLRKYLAALAADRCPEDNAEPLTKQQKIFETAFLGLRQRRGVDLAAFAKQFRRSFDETFKGVVQELEKGGLLVRRDHYLQLTREGLMLCDEVCTRLGTQLEIAPKLNFKNNNSPDDEAEGNDGEQHGPQGQ